MEMIQEALIELMSIRKIVKGREIFPPIPLSPKMPCKAHATDAGFDLYAPEEITLYLNHPTVIGLGFKMQLPPQHFAMITPRSGLAARYGITVLNSPGIVDEHYRDEVMVILYNTGIEYDIKLHERIAQMIILRLPYVKMTMMNIDNQSRGGGLGSSGRF